MLKFFKQMGLKFNSSISSLSTLSKLLWLQADIEKPPTEENLFLANIIKNYYDKKENGIYNMFNDAAFLVPDQVTVKTMSKHNPMVFNYQFTQKTNNSLLGKYFNFTYEDTPLHGDPFLFMAEYQDEDVPPVEFSEEEQRASDIMVKLWTDFA